MDQARGLDDTCRGKCACSSEYIWLLTLLLACSFFPSHGRSTLQRAEESIGTILTKQSSWEMPDVYKQALSKEHLPRYQSRRKQLPDFHSAVGFMLTFHRVQPLLPEADFRLLNLTNHEIGNHWAKRVKSRMAMTLMDPVRKYSCLQIPTMIATFEEAEAAFLKLLRGNNIDPNWTWEQTMRSIIKDLNTERLKIPRIGRRLSRNIPWKCACRRRIVRKREPRSSVKTCYYAEQPSRNLGPTRWKQHGESLRERPSFDQQRMTMNGASYLRIISSNSRRLMLSVK